MCQFVRQNSGNIEREDHIGTTNPMTKQSLQAKREIARLMDSPKWAFLSEDDLDCINKLSFLRFRHPERGMVLAAHWPTYLQLAKLRIALRMYEQRKAHNAQ